MVRTGIIIAALLLSGCAYHEVKRTPNTFHEYYIHHPFKPHPLHYHRY